jgi:hypothetical protein
MPPPPFKVDEINLAFGITCFKSLRNAESSFAFTRQPQITRVRKTGEKSRRYSMSTEDRRQTSSAVATRHSRS